mgnify:CR=1 FL=1
MSDIEIARKAKMQPISEILDKVNVPDTPEAFSPMGRHIAKINLEYIDSLKDKKDGKLLKSCNKVPYLSVDGEIVGQSEAIERYLARRFNLMGDNEIEALLLFQRYQNKNDKGDNPENFGAKEDEVSEAPKSGPNATIGADDTEKRVENENDTGPRHQKVFDLTERKLSHYEREENIVENLNSEEANEASQKEDQIRTDLEGAENQTVRPKKMIFKIPKS